MAQRPEITTVVRSDAETGVLGGRPAHKAAAAALPSSLSHCLRSSGQKRVGSAEEGWSGHSQRRLGQQCLVFRPFHLGVEKWTVNITGVGEGVVQRVVGKTLNSLRRQSCHLGAKLKSRKRTNLLDSGICCPCP